MESATSRCNARSFATGASKGENYVSYALMAVYEKTTYATKQKDYFTGLKLKVVLKQMSTRTEIESQPAILRIWAKL